MNRKSKRYNSANWIDKAAPIFLAVLTFLLTGTIVLVVLMSFGVFQSH